MAAPAIIEPILQKDSGDCVIASLAMILGLPYVEVASTAASIMKQPNKTGLGTRETLRLAHALGHTLESKLTKTLNLDEETGVLFVQQGRSRYHAVVLFQGIIVDPYNGLLYDLTTYFASTHSRPLRILRP